MKPADDAPSSSAQGKPGDVTRNVVSLLLFIHLFCVAVALWGNFQRSAIESRLLEVLAPYLRPFNFDPDFTRFYLVHSPQADDDRFFEVEILPDEESETAAPQQEGGTSTDNRIITLPESGIRGGLARRRYFALSHVMGFYANPDTENEMVTGEIAKAVGGAVLRKVGASRGVLRCRHHMSQPRDLDRLVAGFPPDPTAPQYAVTEYEADVWIDSEGQVQVNPRIAALETAAAEAGQSSQPQASGANGETPKKTDPPAKQENRGEAASPPKSSSGRPSPASTSTSREAAKRTQAAAKAAADKEQKSADPRASRYPFRPLPGKSLPGQPPGADENGAP